MKRTQLEFLVGLFIVAGFLALGFVALQAANLGSLNMNASAYTVTAHFDNIGGLKPRASVKSSGVVVGRVKSVTFDSETFQAKVELAIDSRYVFPTDSSMKILTSGLLGEQYVGITAGAEESNWKEGSVVERTQSAIVLENLIGQLMYQFAEKNTKRMKTKYCLAALTCVAALLTSGCANVPEGAGENPADPWEKMNRNTTAFNDTLDTYFLEPVAKGYRAVTPEPVREGVANAFTNLGEPRNFVNNAFQGNVHGTMASLYRFVVNSVFGLGGLFDVAGKVAGVAEERTGFGTTLGRWGVPSGPYLVLPFFGPSSVRDAPGLLIDQAAHPVTYVKNPWIGWSVTGVRVVSLRTELLPMTDTLRGAVDPYVMAREAYLGNRRMTLGGEEENPFAVDEFEDEDQEPGLGEKL